MTGYTDKTGWTGVLRADLVKSGLFAGYLFGTVQALSSFSVLTVAAA